MVTTSLHIPKQEHDTRAAALLEHIRALGLSGVVLFDNHYILYYTGFAFIPTERPMAFVMSANGEKAMFVPRLELEHAKAKTGFARVDYYMEYPSEPHPARLLAKTLADMGISGRVGADSDGYPWIFGYRGPALSELTGATIHNVRGFIEDAMSIKSPAEIALIKESCKWGNLAHRLLQRYTKVGAGETEVSLRASNEATIAMLDALGGLYASLNMWQEGPSAGYRGQIGRNSAIPHALSNNIVFQEGDVLVTGAGCPMWGYNSELERTMFIGKPNDAQKRMFDHMLAAQTLAIESIRPGAKCSDVDRAVRAYFEAHGLMQYWKHHQGHTIGLRYHEGPFLDIGDDTVIRPGLVFTVEPGLYAPNLGGYRHSDTVLVTEDGTELLTYYPRDLDSLIIPA